MGRRKKGNPFAAKKRLKRENAKQTDPRPVRQEPYEDIKRENAAFCKYYHLQGICTNETEWETFLESIRKNLPSVFRVTGFKGEAQALLKIIETQLFTEEKVGEPICLPWYPNGMAYQLHLTRKDIRRSEPLFRLHNFLIAETSAGNISRQEAVSMIPPLVLDVQPTDKVLDMCAAPGSKTAQLIEALHAKPEEYRIPPGFVVANDVDNNRCYMLVHQAKRLNSPCFVVTNHDSCYMPDLLQSKEDGSKTLLKFNKILCDVPCSGDGTLRKNPDIWNKWKLSQSYCLHGIQYRIARRGAELLEVGGRLVYSTCSMNPIENEAVIQRIVADADGALELIDASHLVPGLKYNTGMLNWKVTSTDIEEVYTTFEQVPEKYHTIIRPNMFPMPEEKLKEIGLEKCIRILPHLQDTGGFFVAVMLKKRQLPFEKNAEEALKQKLAKEEKNQAQMETERTEDGKSEEKSVPWGPQRKRRRMQGYKEDPYVFFNDSDPDWQQIKEFFNLDDTLNHRCLLTRCATERKKNIYYCSEPIRDLVLLNEHNIKIINTGVKAFARCENRNTTNPYRLAQEGLQTTNAFMGPTRRIELTRDDLILLLNCTDPTKPPSIFELNEETQKRCKDMSVGSCILKYVDTEFTIHVVGWRGRSSLRAYVDSNDTVHILRLLGADLSKFEVNKFEKAKEVAEAAEIAQANETAFLEESENLEGVEKEATNVEVEVPTNEDSQDTAESHDDKE